MAKKNLSAIELILKKMAKIFEVSLAGKQDAIDAQHKLSADLITDGATNKVINVKPDWNAASGNAAEILNKPTIPSYNTFGASGANHSSGLVPDPGATQGAAKYLREDGTWAVPVPDDYPVDYSKQYLTFVAKENGTFTFTPTNNNVISYSTDDGSTWTEGNSIQVNSGDKVMWKGEMTPQTSSSSRGIGSFSASTSSFDVQGNAMSLLYGDNFENQTDLSEKNYAFYELFKNCSILVNAENLSLPATTLAQYCYNGMFWGCESLTTAPELPATTLANNCYQFMFRDCNSLTEAPELPATTLANSCYDMMFWSCDSLTTAPELPATTLANSCYKQMFTGCSNLTEAPELPATTLTSNCYSHMFANCNSLTTAPKLPATTLAGYCYSNMFAYCNSLTEAPVLPATTLEQYCYSYMFEFCTSLTIAPALPAKRLAKNCYEYMFFGCTSLTMSPDLPAKTLANYCYQYMFKSCTNLAIAPVLPATTAGYYCYAYMFADCERLTVAPELPATTLATYCYYQMFAGCTNLTKAPELPATTLLGYCYYMMFYGCTNLSNITCLATNISASNCTNKWVYGVAANGTFVKDASISSWTTGENGIPAGWDTYTEDEYEVVRHYEIPAELADYVQKSEIYEEISSGYVDLGLPSGLLWATGNIVKDTDGNYSIGEETDYGCYFSWGNIEGHNTGDEYNFNSETYANTAGSQVSADIASSDSVHDAALACLGNPWHLPTSANFQELYDNTDREWTTIDGVYGWKFMKRTDNSVYIFLPASGEYHGSDTIAVGLSGNYRSSSWISADTAYIMEFDNSYMNPQFNLAFRDAGYSVRAVANTTPPPTPTPKYAQKSELADVATSGSYNDLEDKPTTMGASGSTHKGGLVPDPGSTQGTAKYLREDATWAAIPNLSLEVSKSALIEINETLSGTDNNIFLSSISVNNHTITANLKNISELPIIASKEDKMTVVTQSSGTTLTAAVGNYYRFTYDVGTLNITLPTPTGSNTQSVLFFLTTGASPAIAFASTGNSIYKSDGFAIDASTTYEINALWNGGAWVINAVKYDISASEVIGVI